MSSLKMTFSLTSLILIIALGLVFVPTSVMAHKLTPASNTNDSHVSGDQINPNNHVAHPVVKSVTLLDDAADGYVGIDSFEVDITFETASTTVPRSLPTAVVNIGLQVSSSGNTPTLSLVGQLHKRSDTLYRGRYSLTGGASGQVLTFSVTPGNDEIYTPAPPATGDDPGRPKATYDTTSPEIATGELQAVPDKQLPLNGQLEEEFDVVFVITDNTDQAGSGGDGAGKLDGDTFDVMAAPDELTFSNKRWLGGSKYAATATPKAVTADETTTTSVTITATIEDMADNEGSGTATATLAKRTAPVVPAGDPPTATITASGHTTTGVMATFSVRVDFAPATGGSNVTGFDHSDLTVVDSSATPRPVTVTPANMPGASDDEGNLHPEPLSGTNFYDGVLEYDTRNKYTYPLVITIDQTSLVTHNPTESANVGTAAPTPVDPDTRAIGTFSGTLSLTAQSIITITFDKAVPGLKSADIAVTGGSVTSLRVKPNLTAAMANKVWEVAIDPDNDPFTESITVTIATASTLAKPATMMGRLTTRVADGTLNSIAAATGANDSAAFIVSFTFAAALPDGVSLTANDLKVTPTTATVGTPVASPANAKVWQVLITPTAGMDTTIDLSDAGKLKFAYTGAALIVMKATAGPIAGDVTAAYDTATKTTTISKGAIAGNGFAVIRWTSNPTLPDLELFFDIGGTIGLDDGDGADDKNSRTVVISEILWGLDLGAAFNMQQQHQFIELYNTTAATIDISGWKLIFTEGNVLPAIDIDQVSNRGPSGWEVDTGDTGKSGRVTGTVATDQTSLITPINIISMYRNIDYTKVEKIHDANNATENRKKQLDGFPSGNAKGSWKNSIRRSANRWIYSTPGAKHHETIGILQPSSVAGTPFRINEIGNDVSGDNDWVELHNLSDDDQSLKNYALTVVTNNSTDTELFDFQGDDWDKRKIPAKGFVVISTRHPSQTDLATGKDISIPDDDELNKGLSHLYVVREGWNLPDDGKFALILRNAHDKQGKAEALIDVVATRQGAFSATNTSLWPLKLGGNPHENVIDGGDENFASGKVYQRNSGDGRGEKQFAVAGYTGIGYDVKAAKVSSNHGTPGYDNGANRDKKAALTGGVVTISEIMFDVGSARRNLPQWIELHNSSATEGVNLNGWKLHIENAASVDGDQETNTFYATVTIGAKTILPNQTLLVASSTGNVRDPNHFPPTRVVNLWTTKAHRDALEMTRSTDPVLSTRGFNITLADKDNTTVDEAGNLDGKRRSRDEPTWVLPMYDAPDGRSRSSILRVYDQKVAVTGTTADAWKLASDTILAFEVSHAYYGNADDIGSPGYRTGGPLPVSLSKFRPERLKDTGEIVVRWATESELNNAGFNILRSEKRDGEFTKVHFEAGQGTTSERSVYEWKDTTAKPNVVYYYQIQDVSLDGDVTTLRVTHLRGNVTAAGKATTTWGEIKALQ